MPSRSKRLLQRARSVIPGGVNSPVRAWRAVGGDPPFVARGEGAEIIDEDGHRYVDLVNSWGALLFGHADRWVLGAVTSAVARGSSFGAPTEAEVLLAEAVKAKVPSVEKLRLCSSGTESTMHALRVARGATGRDAIVKMDGCYHGAHDAVLVGAGSGVATFGIPDSPGVPAAVAKATFVVPFNDLDAVEGVLAKESVAAVIVEPVAGNMGCVAPVEGYLAGLRSLCDRHGTVLIFDEVMTGFRVASGGAQARYGVRPDLTCMGKILGGGFPLAAFGGRADLMDRLAPEGPIYQAGTLSGNPVAVAAALATIERLDDAVYAKLEALGQQLEAGLQDALAYHGWSLARVGSMFTLFARPVAPKNYAEAKECDREAFAEFFRAAMSGGAWIPASQFEAAFLSAAMGEPEIDAVVAAFGAALVACGER